MIPRVNGITMLNAQTPVGRILSNIQKHPIGTGGSPLTLCAQFSQLLANSSRNTPGRLIVIHYRIFNRKSGSKFASLFVEDDVSQCDFCGK